LVDEIDVGIELNRKQKHEAGISRRARKARSHLLRNYDVKVSHISGLVSYPTGGDGGGTGKPGMNVFPPGAGMFVFATILELTPPTTASNS
jgi:hypothetical protein